MKGLRRAGGRGSALVEAKISSVLEDLAPLLHIDHCSLELSSFDAMSGELTISISGTCPDCAGSPAMFATAIEAHVRQRVAQVTAVRVESGE